MSLFVIPDWFTTIWAVTLAGLAVWKGGWRERAIAVTAAVETLIGYYVCPYTSCRFEPHALWATEPVWRPLVEDGVILTACLVCLVRADRYWVVWACSFALLAELSDLTMFETGITRWARISASLVWTYAVQCAVLWGLLAHRVAARDRRLPRSA